MAISVTLVSDHPSIEGNRRVVYADVTTSSYTTSGDAFTANDFALGEIVSIGIEDAATSTGFLVNVDYTNSKFKAFYFDYDAAADGAAIEAAAASDIGTYRVRVVGTG